MRTLAFGAISSLKGRNVIVVHNNRGNLWMYLSRLAEHCDYSVLREQLIRDRIVVGVIDDALSDRLQAQADLTLAQSVQRNVVRSGNTKFNPTTVEMVKRSQRSTGNSAATPKHHAGKCKWCGQQQHDRKVCPARQAICHNCQKPGHFSSVCQSSPQIKPHGKSHVHSIGDVFLGEFNDQGNSWTADITVNGHQSRNVMKYIYFVTLLM